MYKIYFEKLDKSFPKPEESESLPFQRYMLPATSEPGVNAVGAVGFPDSGLDAVLKSLNLDLQIVLGFKNKFSGWRLDVDV